MELIVQSVPAYCYSGGKVFDTSLPTVVFIHGAQNDHSVWALQSRYFAHHGYSVLAVDLPGHGRSTGPALDSVEALAQWLLHLLDAAGVQRAALFGHSMGSLIALEASFQAPGRVSHLGLVEAPTRCQSHRPCWKRRATTKRAPSTWSTSGRTPARSGARPTPDLARWAWHAA